ncbi:MAG: stress response translation initiation inhibitor YciH [Candidatus Eremiobacteraeota bacterium]|nr:stress response translation initiation inhibitor YciH [Candidatus Eremiobacteraeota bacterium]
MKDDRTRDERVLVYSTDGSLPLPAPQRRKPQPVARAMPDDGVIRVAREKRRASALTVIYGIPAAELDAAAKELKRLCGSGGTAKNGTLELQGDHRETVERYFRDRGRRVKRAGG